MLNKIKTRFLQISALTALSLFGFGGVAVAQTGPNPQGSICRGAATLQVSSQNAGNEECTSGADGQDPSTKVNDLIRQIINIFSVIVGIVAVIMIIYGGFKYITSGGDSNNITGAKNTILYAIIGLIIVALAQFIVRFILSKTAETAQ
jgi:uncharacterized membrane protein YidH (DUF202 family)